MPSATGAGAASSSERSSTVKLHCNHVRDSHQLSGVLKSLWGDGNFRVELRNDLYIIHKYTGATIERKAELMPDHLMAS
jgi:hypothetical protein